LLDSEVIVKIEKPGDIRFCSDVKNTVCLGRLLQHRRATDFGWKACWSIRSGRCFHINSKAYKVKDKLEIVKGSGNVFQDLGYQNADVEQLKSQLAADIIRVLDEQKLSVRKAATKTGFDHADFSRIRNADLGRFTIDRLVTVLNRLNQHVEIKVTPAHGQ